MTIKKLYFLLYSIIGAVLLSLGLMIYLVLQNQEALNRSQVIRYQSFLLANELRQSSDQLTTMARTYAATHDRQYEQKYWDILAVRNGHKPRPDGRTVSLKALMKEIGFTDQEFDKLREAEEKSNALVEAETLAMKIITDQLAAGVPAHDTSGTELVPAVASGQSEAIRLLFDQKYHEEKLRIMQPIDDFMNLLTARTESTVAGYVAAGNRYLMILVTLFAILVTVIVVSYLAIQRKVISRLVLLTRLTENAQRMSEGDFTAGINIASADEIGDLAGAVNSLSAGLREKADFALAIGKGNLEAVYQPLSEKDALGQGLLEMRNNLKAVAQEDKKRQWAVEGLAQFADILRHSHQIKELGDMILSSLVKYVRANQGGLYVLNDTRPEESCLELISCYAFNRKKYVEQYIGVGQGLVGQTYLEKETTYLTNVPEDYIRITSGLGDASPRSLLIVPLKVNNQVEGILELASMQPWEPHEINFVEKVAETIAAAFVSVKINERTRLLLAESQMQAEQMRAAEEEMRQNLEEISATQEEMQRILREAESKEGYLYELINATTDSIFTLDREYKVVVCNQALKEMYKGYGIFIEKGFEILRVFSSEQKLIYLGYYDRALSGETFTVTENYQLGDEERHYSISYSPLRRGSEIIGLSVFGREITPAAAPRKPAEALSAQSQQPNGPDRE